MKRPLVILTGPTAVGKTALSIQLARKIEGSIISADSMQVYRHMDIGSAKVTKEEQAEIPHYLIDCLDPREPFSVAEFQTMARAAMEDIYAQNRIPIITGGTGFYIQSILYDIDFTEMNQDQDYRDQLNQFAQENGDAALYEKLLELDYEAAIKIPYQNRKRVVRALEYYHLTGEKISEHNMREQQKNSPYQFAYFVLTDERSKLYKRIDLRVDQMVNQGLLDEVSQLKKLGCTPGMTSMMGIGYREVLDYLIQNSSWEQCVDDIKKNTRHYAKRQLTWFRREKDVIWLSREDYQDDDAMLIEIEKQLKERGIMK